MPKDCVLALPLLPCKQLIIFSSVSSSFFFLSIGEKAATSELVSVPWNFLYSEKAYLFICYLKDLLP